MTTLYCCQRPVPQIDDYYTERGRLTSERNRRLAAIYADHCGYAFGGALGPDETPPVRDFALFLAAPMEPARAKTLGISSIVQIYGCVGERASSTKVAYHPPLPSARYIPAGFPAAFAAAVQKAELSLPGYSVFTADDARDAFRELHSAGYIPRLKPPSHSSGWGQRQLNDSTDLERALEGLSERDLRRDGLVLEATLLNADDPTARPLAFGGGWTDIAGQRLHYLSTQRFGEIAGDVDMYTGGTFLVSRGALPPPQRIEARYRLAAHPCDRMIELFALLPVSLCNRVTFNFIHGRLAGERGGEGVRTAVVEHSLRVGAATGAHLRAAQWFREQPDAPLVEVDIDFDSESSAAGLTPIRSDDWVLASQSYPAHGRCRWIVRGPIAAEPCAPDITQDSTTGEER